MGNGQSDAKIITVKPRGQKIAQDVTKLIGEIFRVGSSVDGPIPLIIFISSGKTPLQSVILNKASATHLLPEIHLPAASLLILSIL